MGKEKTYRSPVNIRNKRAEHDFLLLDHYMAGIVLTGTEIKSIRAGKASLVDTYCLLIRGELWVKNMYIAHYLQGSYNNHVERRDRKLLLTARELRRLAADVKTPGQSIVPTRVFIDEHGRAKVDVYLVRGKREYDKRQTLKERDDKREIARAMAKKL